MKRTKGFTLVELLVVVAIIALLIAILLPSLGRAMQLAEQAACMSNLSGIAKGWGLYGNDNNRLPPILPDIDQSLSKPYGTYWCEDLKMGKECTAAALDHGGQQNLCLLVKGGFVPWGIFICPSSGNIEAADRGKKHRKYGMGEIVGYTMKGYCDYGIQAPYYYGHNFNRNRCALTRHMDGGIVILADKAPRWYYCALVSLWSANHPDDGASILYVSGSVRFSKDEVDDDYRWGRVRNTGGWGGNCIYTSDGWDTSHPNSVEKPRLLYRAISGSGAYGLSTKDTVLWWWPEKQF